MLAAVGVILLYLGSMVELIDISMAVIASLLCVFAVIEYGKSAPWLVFGVTAVLSLLLLPQKTPALMYTLFFGYYPILKEKFEKLNITLCWILKECVFNVALILILVSMKYLLFESLNISFMLYVIAVVLCEVVFVVYDFALTRLISLYVYKLRNRFKIK
ncbi:MAG: hypothetical protein IJZ83_10465 [Clostridia bacterium]|nr:hypothetical protein [Clostridia bacterium]